MAGARDKQQREYVDLNYMWIFWNVSLLNSQHYFKNILLFCVSCAFWHFFSLNQVYIEAMKNDATAMLKVTLIDRFEL